MPIMSFNSKLGAAKETTWGTAVSAPTFWIPVSSGKLEDEVKRVTDSGRRGNLSKDFASYASITTGKAELEGFVHPDLEGNFLLGTFGQDAVTGTGTYTHAFTLATTQPPSYTLFDYDGFSERAMAGSVIEELGYKFTVEGELTRSVKFTSKASAATSTHTAAFTNVTPFMGYQCAMTIAGSANVRMIGGEITLKRSTKMTFGANNSQQPTKANVGQMEVTGKLDFEIDDYTEYNYYLNNTQPTVVLTFTSGTNTLVFQMTKCDFEKISGLDRSQEMVRVSANIRALYNATDAGPIKVTLTNSVATY